MNFPITEEMREQAAVLCSMMASTPGEWFVPPCVALGVDCHDLLGPAELARKALYATTGWREDHKEHWAEAEALLRTGWTP